MSGSPLHVKSRRGITEARKAFRDVGTLVQFRPPPLEKDDVHIWSVDLLGGKQSCVALTKEEQDRADAFIRTEDRVRYEVSRAALRILLGRYVGRSPGDLRLGTGPNGKPALVDHPGVRFNLSRSGRLALIGLAMERDIGVDLAQRCDPDDGQDQIADFFAPEERNALRLLPAGQSAAAFTEVWTRKEAVVKALGDGLYRALDSFVVPVLPDDPPVVRFATASPWYVFSLNPRYGYCGAIAIGFQPTSLACGHLS